MSFKDSIKTFCPPWLADDSPQSVDRPAGGVGGRIMYVLGLMTDANLEKLNQGMLAHMPGQGTPTALPLLGDDRLIERGLTESDAGYATRLSEAFDSWHFAGTNRGVLSQVLGYLLADVPGGAILQINPDTTHEWVKWQWYEAGQPLTQAPLYTLDHPQVTYSGTTALPLPDDPRPLFAPEIARWRWWLFINQGAWFAAAPVIGTAGTTIGQTGTSVGAALPASVGDDLRRIATLWKQAGSWCREILLCPSPPSYTASGISTPPVLSPTMRVDWSAVSFSTSAVAYVPHPSTATGVRYVAGVANYSNSLGGWQVQCVAGDPPDADTTTPGQSFCYADVGGSLAILNTSYRLAVPDQVQAVFPKWSATAPGTGPLY